jgi:hypothetical protein
VTIRLKKIKKGFKIAITTLKKFFNGVFYGQSSEKFQLHDYNIGVIFCYEAKLISNKLCYLIDGLVVDVGGQRRVLRPDHAVASDRRRNVRVDPLARRANVVPQDQTLGQGSEHQKVRTNELEQELRFGSVHPGCDSLIA